MAKCCHNHSALKPFESLFIFPRGGHWWGLLHKDKTWNKLRSPIQPVRKIGFYCSFTVFFCSTPTVSLWRLFPQSEQNCPTNFTNQLVEKCIQVRCLVGSMNSRFPTPRHRFLQRTSWSRNFRAPLFPYEKYFTKSWRFISPGTIYSSISLFTLVPNRLN